MRISDWSSDVCSSDLACETVAKSASAALIWQPPRQSRDDKKRPRPREAGGADPKRAICLARITGQMAYLLTVRPALLASRVPLRAFSRANSTSLWLRVLASARKRFKIGRAHV